MSLIMTKRGWRQLQPVKQVVHPAENDHGRYEGPLPSMECLAYLKRCERDHAEWLELRARMVG